jgi:citrate synthase
LVSRKNADAAQADDHASVLDAKQAGLYLTADEAAQMLGVSVRSLYAYVGRKGIRSQPVPGQRARLYWREDIEKIASRSTDERVIKWDSILVRETKITLVTESGHYYRGRSAIELSETWTLEQVAGLLWEQEVGDIFPDRSPAVPEGFKIAQRALAGLSAADQAGSLFALIEEASPRSFDRSPLGFARTGAELLRWFAAMVAHADAPTAAPIHRVLSEGLGVSDVYSDIIRRILVLFADHDLTAPTYAVRAVANTGSTPYQVVIAGLLASKGQRITEGKNRSIDRLISEILGASDPGRPVIDRYRAGEAIPGFPHSVYKSGDARARALLSVMQERLHDDADFDRLRRAIRIAHDGIGVEPSLGLVSQFVERKLGIRDLGSIQIMARLAGWLAHASEQMASGPMVRPRTAYTGALPATSKRNEGVILAA